MISNQHVNTSTVNYFFIKEESLEDLLLEGLQRQEKNHQCKRQEELIKNKEKDIEHKKIPKEDVSGNTEKKMIEMKVTTKCRGSRYMKKFKLN